MTACLQPGCGGQLDDGYCDTCGLAPLPAPLPSGAQEAPAVTSPAPPLSSVASAPSVPSATSAPPTPAAPRTRAPAPRLHRATRRCAWTPLAPQDPLAALVPGEVPQQRRFCSNCEEPLRADRGRCHRCSQEFSFLPGLYAGQVLANRYEIKGTLAFGGLGWIYLALDLVLGRWVTLKGLLNAHDRRLLEVAVQEREYLALVKHPNIVAIYDFLPHEHQGFIVMEFVNGLSLTKIRKIAGGPLPLGDALAYIHEALPALEHLHEQGLVYCDFKPDNVMVEEDSLKLIDLGAVRRVDEEGGDIYGSRGYNAPEAAERPSPCSDIYSVGRTLALLVASFDYQGKYEHELPPPSECEVFSRHPAFFALLKKATAKDPERRFASASEFREQLAGVLALEAAKNLPSPPTSRLFVLGDAICREDPDQDRSLPLLLIDEQDEGASLVLAAEKIGNGARRKELLQRGLRTHPRSPGLRLRLLGLLIELSEWNEATRRLAELEHDDWRGWWYQGALLLGRGKGTEAIPVFQQICDELPGELAPRLALARAHEAAEQWPQAAALYEQILKAAPSIAICAFGLVRCCLQQDDRRKAVQALRSVDLSSRFHAQASLQLATLLLTQPEVDDVLEAAEILEGLSPQSDSLSLAILRADTLAAAAQKAAKGEVRGGTVLGVAFEERALRQAAEQAYRVSASLCGEPELRSHLIEEAHLLRPWSLF